MSREDMAWSHYHSPTSAGAHFGIYSWQKERDNGYLVIEQCLADWFRGSRCGRRRCEWRRLVGHCVTVRLQKLFLAAMYFRGFETHGIRMSY